MSYIPDKIRRFVKERANNCCEYCLIHQDDAFKSFEIDHIYAEKHGGETIENNLSCCCSECNRHKGTDLASIDETNGQITPLFHPRKQIWADHFRLNGTAIEPLTPEGRVTVRLLQLNNDERVEERSELIALSRYPVK